MTNSLATLALVCLLAGSAVAQQKPSKSSSRKASKTGTMSSADAARSNPSAANTHDGTNGASTGTGGGGTGLTNDQSQAAANPTGNGPAKVDANSSVRTGPESVKGKKRTPKSNN